MFSDFCSDSLRVDGIRVKRRLWQVTNHKMFWPIISWSNLSQLHTWIMTTKMTKRTKSRFIFELLSRSLAWYKHTSIEWFSFPIRSLIIRCSSTKGLIASWRLELEELWRRECFSTKFWIEPPPALLVSLSWKVFFQWLDVYLGELPKNTAKTSHFVWSKGAGVSKIWCVNLKKGHFHKV